LAKSWAGWALVGAAMAVGGRRMRQPGPGRAVENAVTDPLESPANRMHVVEATLALAARLSGAVRAGQIDESIYLRPIKLETGGTGVRLPAYPQGTKADLYNGIDNIFLLAVSNSALTTDEADAGRVRGL